MAFMKNINDLGGILALLVLTISSTAANIDCNGKPFHCLNSTHFMICVDVGSGVSSTLDDFVIPCPPTTVCKGTNRFECEFLAVTTTTTTVAPSVAPLAPSTSELTSPLYDVTTSIPFEEYYNTLSTTTLSEYIVLAQKTDVTEFLVHSPTMAQNMDVIVPESKLNSDFGDINQDMNVVQNSFTLSPKNTSVDASNSISDVPENDTIQYVSTIVSKPKANSTLSVVIPTARNIEENGFTSLSSLTSTSVPNYVADNVTESILLEITETAPPSVSTFKETIQNEEVVVHIDTNTEPMLIKVTNTAPNETLPSIEVVQNDFSKPETSLFMSVDSSGLTSNASENNSATMNKPRTDSTVSETPRATDFVKNYLTSLNAVGSTVFPVNADTITEQHTQLILGTTENVDVITNIDMKDTETPESVSTMTETISIENDVHIDASTESMFVKVTNISPSESTKTTLSVDGVQNDPKTRIFTTGIISAYSSDIILNATENTSVKVTAPETNFTLIETSAVTDLTQNELKSLNTLVSTALPVNSDNMIIEAIDTEVFPETTESLITPEFDTISTLSVPSDMIQNEHTTLKSLGTSYVTNVNVVNTTTQSTLVEVRQTTPSVLTVTEVIKSVDLTQTDFTTLSPLINMSAINKPIPDATKINVVPEFVTNVTLSETISMTKDTDVTPLSVLGSNFVSDNVVNTTTKSILTQVTKSTPNVLISSGDIPNVEVALNYSKIPATFSHTSRAKTTDVTSNVTENKNIIMSETETNTTFIIEGPSDIIKSKLNPLTSTSLPDIITESIFIDVNQATPNISTDIVKNYITSSNMSSLYKIKYDSFTELTDADAIENQTMIISESNLTVNVPASEIPSNVTLSGNIITRPAVTDVTKVVSTESVSILTETVPTNTLQNDTAILSTPSSSVLLNNTEVFVAEPTIRKIAENPIFIEAEYNSNQALNGSLLYKSVNIKPLFIPNVTLQNAAEPSTTNDNMLVNSSASINKTETTSSIKYHDVTNGISTTELPVEISTQSFKDSLAISIVTDSDETQFKTTPNPIIETTVIGQDVDVITYSNMYTEPENKIDYKDSFTNQASGKAAPSEKVSSTDTVEYTAPTPTFIVSTTDTAVPSTLTKYESRFNSNTFIVDGTLSSIYNQKTRIPKDSILGSATNYDMLLVNTLENKGSFSILNENGSDVPVLATSVDLVPITETRGEPAHLMVTKLRSTGLNPYDITEKPEPNDNNQLSAMNSLADSSTLRTTPDKIPANMTKVINTVPTNLATTLQSGSDVPVVATLLDLVPITEIPEEPVHLMVTKLRSTGLNPYDITEKPEPNDNSQLSATNSSADSSMLQATLDKIPANIDKVINTEPTALATTFSFTETSQVLFSETAKDVSAVEVSTIESSVSDGIIRNPVNIDVVSEATLQDPPKKLASISTTSMNILSLENDTDIDQHLIKEALHTNVEINGKITNQGLPTVKTVIEKYTRPEIKNENVDHITTKSTKDNEATPSIIVNTEMLYAENSLPVFYPTTEVIATPVANKLYAKTPLKTESSTSKSDKKKNTTEISLPSLVVDYVQSAIMSTSDLMPDIKTTASSVGDPDFNINLQNKARQKNLNTNLQIQKTKLPVQNIFKVETDAKAQSFTESLGRTHILAAENSVTESYYPVNQMDVTVTAADTNVNSRSTESIVIQAIRERNSLKNLLLDFPVEHEPYKIPTSTEKIALGSIPIQFKSATNDMAVTEDYSITTRNSVILSNSIQRKSYTEPMINNIGAKFQTSFQPKETLRNEFDHAIENKEQETSDSASAKTISDAHKYTTSQGIPEKQIIQSKVLDMQVEDLKKHVQSSADMIDSNPVQSGDFITNTQNNTYFGVLHNTGIKVKEAGKTQPTTANYDSANTLEHILIIKPTIISSNIVDTSTQLTHGITINEGYPKKNNVQAVVDPVVSNVLEASSTTRLSTASVTKVPRTSEYYVETTSNPVSESIASTIGMVKNINNSNKNNVMDLTASRTEFINIPKVIFDQTTKHVEQVSAQNPLHSNLDKGIVIVDGVRTTVPVSIERIAAGTHTGTLVLPKPLRKSKVDQSERAEGSKSVENSETKEEQENKEKPEAPENNKDVHNSIPVIETTIVNPKELLSETGLLTKQNKNLNETGTRKTVTNNKITYESTIEMTIKKDQDSDQESQSIINIELLSSDINSSTESFTHRPNIENSTTRYTPTTKSQYTNTHNASLPTSKSATNLRNFVCKLNSRGRFSDSKDCRKFYVCIGKTEPIEGFCPKNTVFSELRKQCTKNLSHCIRNNQFQCVWEGRFSDFLNDNIYYICVKNNVGTFVRFKLQCQTGYHLNKTSVRCALNTESSQSTSRQSTSDISKNNSDLSVSLAKSEKLVNESSNTFKCKKEGKFPDANNCRKYYICTKIGKSQYRQKNKKCDSDELFHKDKKKCVDADSYECN